MIAGMDDLAQTELHEAILGLGQWHKVDAKSGDPKKKNEFHYLIRVDECMTCLKDVLIALKQDKAETGNLVHLKLGEWKVVTNQLVPLFTAYRENKEITSTVLKVLIQLTAHVEVHPSQKYVLLQCLQDYKEAFVRKDVFIILMGMLVAAMGDDADEEETQQRGDEEVLFEDILTLLRNVMSVPDPRPGDAGFTPMRKDMQLSYIKNFHDEGVLEFFQFFAEQLQSEKNTEQVWSLLEILYHIVAQLDPEVIMQTRTEKDRRVLADLLERDQAHARINRTQASRHSRFGTTMQKRDALGGVSNAATMVETSTVSKGNRIWNRDFRNLLARGNKENTFQDPFFVDLEEGSVSDHNQINPHVRQSLEMANDMPKGVLMGLRKFFESFVQLSFSDLVSYARGTVLVRTASDLERATRRPYGRQHLLNFMSWVLEFHRHHYFAEVAKAKENKETVPIMDIASIQGAIDLDMIQFVAGRLREYGKQSQIHSSFLVLALRALTQQVKTVAIIMDSQDAETRDCGEVLTQNIVKEDVMFHLVWIMKNYKSSSHDPRVLSYTVEVFHHVCRLMRKTEKLGAGKAEFHVERAFGVGLRRAITTVDGEIESLADAAVVENLFHLLEKWKRHSAQLNSMLVKLIYAIIRAKPANIVVFFELSYFVRIHRIWSDPLIQDRRQGKKYQEMIELLRFILRQFFKCAEKNRCVFVELLFRKTFEKSKDAVLETRQSEFEAILDNYEDEGYAQFLDRMRHGESFDAMRARQRALADGSLPWSEEEDKVLRDRYSAFMDHPLCMELLAAELPVESRRTPKGVKKRLLDLGIFKSTKDRRREETEADADRFHATEGSPSKKLKLHAGAGGSKAMDGDDFDMDMPMFQDEDIDTLEMDLEKLLDAEEFRRTDDTMPDTSIGASSGLASGSAAGAAETAVDPEADTQPGLGLDLEQELEAMMDESGCFSESPAPPMRPATSTVPDSGARSTPATGSAPEANSLEEDLEALLAGSFSQNSQADSPAVKTATATAESATQGSEQGGDEEQRFWEDAVDAEGVHGEAAASSAQQLGSGPEEAIAGSQASLFSQESTLEMALEKIIDESLA